MILQELFFMVGEKIDFSPAEREEFEARIKLIQPLIKCEKGPKQAQNGPININSERINLIPGGILPENTTYKCPSASNNINSGVIKINNWGNIRKKRQSEAMRTHWASSREHPVFKIWGLNDAQNGPININSGRIKLNQTPFTVVGYKKLAEIMRVGERTARSYIYKGRGSHHFTDEEGNPLVAERVSKGRISRGDKNPAFLLLANGQAPRILPSTREAADFLYILEGTLWNYVSAGRGVYDYKTQGGGRLIQITRPGIDLEALGVAGIVEELCKTEGEE